MMGHYIANTLMGVVNYIRSLRDIALDCSVNFGMMKICMVSLSLQPNGDPSSNMHYSPLV